MLKARLWEPRWRFLAVLACVLAVLAQLPVARAEPGYAVGIRSDVREGVAPLVVTFGLTLFTQSGGRIREARLDFGDGSPAENLPTAGAVRPQHHIYRQPGRYQATVTIVTAEGEELSSTTTVVARPRFMPAPEALITAAPTQGLAPLEVTFTLDLDRLPFQPPRIVTLDPGDGGGDPLFIHGRDTATWRYDEAGTYDVRLIVRGDYGNVARGRAMVTVIDEPVLDLAVHPAAGNAPVTVRADAIVPEDVTDVALTLDGEPVVSDNGSGDYIIVDPGTHVFVLTGRAATGDTVSVSREVEVLGRDLSGLYEHRGGLAAIGADGVSFTGAISVVSPEMLSQGYSAGQQFVDGVHAEGVATLEVPGTSDGAGLPAGPLILPGSEQFNRGRYLVLQGEKCPEQWGDYDFTIDYGWEERPAQIEGTVRFRRAMPRYERAHNRLGLPIPRPGIANKIEWVAEMINVVRQAGDTGNYDDCVLDDGVNATLFARFTRVTEDEAQQLVQRLRDEYDERIRELIDQAAGGSDWQDPGNDRGNGPANGRSVRGGDPVELHSGEFVLSAIDLAVESRGLHWEFQRTYRSQSLDSSALGHGWTHNAMFALVRDGADWVFRAGGDVGRRLTPTMWGNYEGAGGLRLSERDGLRVVRDIDGTVYTLEPLPGDDDRSRIVSVADAWGNTIAYDTDFRGRVTGAADTLGRIATYTYDSETQLLVAVTAPDGQTVRFRHEDDGDLAAVDIYGADAEAPYRSYAYRYADPVGVPALDHNMTAAWMPADLAAGRAGIELTYGTDAAAHEFDRVIRQRDHEAEAAFAYATGSADGAAYLETTVIMPDRATERVRFDPATLRPIETAFLMPDGEELVIQRSFDDAGRLLEEVLPAGNGQRVVRDAAGNPVEVRHFPRPGSPLPDRVYALAHDARSGRMQALRGPFADAVPDDPEARDARLVVAYEYDADTGTVLSVTRGAEPAFDGAPRPPIVTRYEYNDRGQVIAHRRPGQPDILLTYQRDEGHGPGLVTRIEEAFADGRRRPLAAFEYDDAGRIIGQTDPVAGGLLFDLGADGRVATAAHGDDAVYTRSWDADGRLTAIAADGATGPIATFAYDARGELVTHTRRIDDETTAVRSLAYTPYAELAALEEAGYRIEFQRDALGRPVAATTTVDGAEVQRRTLAYDANGLIIGATDARGWTTEYQIDGHDRVAGVLLPDGRYIDRTLDLEGRVTATRLFASEAAFQAGETPLAAEGTRMHPLGGAYETWIQVRTPNGSEERVLERIHRDAHGRIERVEAPGVGTIDYAYDADGRLVAMVDAELGLTRSFAYNADGRVAEVVTSGDAGPPRIERIAFDEQGREIERRSYPEGLITRTSHDARGDPVLTEMFLVLGEEEVAFARERRSYDGLGRVIAIVAETRVGDAWHTVFDRRYVFDGLIGPTEIHENGRRIAAFGYDGMGALLTAQHFDGPMLRYETGYTAAVSRMTDGRGWVHEARSRQEGAPPGGEVITVVHSGASDTPPIEIELVRDADGRLIAHSRGDWRVSETLDLAAATLRREAGGYRWADRWIGGSGTRERTLPSGLEMRVSEAGDGTAEVDVLGRSIAIRYGGTGMPTRIAAGDIVLATSAEVTDSGTRALLTTAVEGAEGLTQQWELDESGLVAVRASDGHALVIAARDAFGRIVDGSADSEAFAFGYDDFGNRLVDGAAYDRWRLAEWHGDATAYDGDGRLAAHGARNFVYDGEGALAEVLEDGATVASYTMDAVGQVVGREAGGAAESYLHDDWGLIATMAGDRPLVDWLRDLRGNLIGAVDWSGDAPELLLAIVGPDDTLHALVDARGQAQLRLAYGPQGETRVEGALPGLIPGLHGMLFDPATRLYLTRTRAYDPEIGRFLQPDPLGAEHVAHPYAFAEDDPYTYADVLGTTSIPSDQDINQIMRDGARNPQDANWLVRFGLWVHGLFDASTDGLDYVTEAMENGEGDPERLSRITSRIESAMPSKATAYTAEELHGLLAENLIQQMAWETFGPALIGGGLEILARGGRLAPDVLRGLMRRLGRDVGTRSGVDNWMERQLMRQAAEAAEFNRAAALSPFRPATWDRPVRSELDHLIDDALRAADLDDIRHLVDEVRWVYGDDASPFFRAVEVPGPNGTTRVYRYIAIPDRYRAMGNFSNEFARRAQNLLEAGHELGHAEEFARRLANQFNGNQRSAYLEWLSRVQNRGARYAGEEVLVETRAFQRMTEYLGMDRVRQLAPEVVADSERYRRSWQPKVLREALRGNF